MIYVCDFHTIHSLFFPIPMFSQFSKNFNEQFLLNFYSAQVISETTLNHSLEPVKTIKINPSVSTVTVSNTRAQFYVKIRFRFRVKPGVLHNTGACRKCAVNKVTYNYRGGRKRSFRTSNRKERLILIGPRTGYPTKTTFLYFNLISVTFFS